MRHSEKINVLRQIVSAALQVTDSGKLYNTIRRDEYNVDEDGSDEFAIAWMIAIKIRCMRWVYGERRQRKKG